MRGSRHEVYKAKNSSNIGLGLILVGFVVLVFSVTVVKLSTGQSLQGFDHVLRPEMVENNE